MTELERQLAEVTRRCVYVRVCVHACVFVCVCVHAGAHEPPSAAHALLVHVCACELVSFFIMEFFLVYKFLVDMLNVVIL